MNPNDMAYMNVTTTGTHCLASFIKITNRYSSWFVSLATANGSKELAEIAEHAQPHGEPLFSIKGDDRLGKYKSREAAAEAFIKQGLSDYSKNLANGLYRFDAEEKS